MTYDERYETHIRKDSYGINQELRERLPIPNLKIEKQRSNQNKKYVFY